MIPLVLLGDDVDCLVSLGQSFLVIVSTQLASQTNTNSRRRSLAVHLREADAVGDFASESAWQ